MQNIFATSADVKRSAQLQKSFAHALAQAGGTAGDQDSLAGKQILLEHNGVLSFTLA
jgi:hypothetical protein